MKTVEYSKYLYILSIHRCTCAVCMDSGEADELLIRLRVCSQKFIKRDGCEQTGCTLAPRGFFVMQPLSLSPKTCSAFTVTALFIGAHRTSIFQWKIKTVVLNGIETFPRLFLASDRKSQL